MKIRREAKIGIFGLLMILLTYWGFNFLKGRDLFSRNNTYYAQYEQVGDLQVSAPIVVKGVKIGVVTGIEIKDLYSNVIVRMNIRSKYRIPDNSQAKIVSTSLLGGKGIEIDLGDSPVYMRDRDTLRSSIDKGLLDMAGSELELIKQKASKVVDEIVTTLHNVNQLLSEDNLNNIHGILGNVSALTADASGLVAQEKVHIAALVENLNAFSAMLKETAPRMEGTLVNLENITDSLRQAEVHRVFVRAGDLMDQLNITAEALNGTEGTAGRLINDPQLYNKLLEASHNLSVLLEDLKAHPGRYVHFSVFGRKDR